MKSHHLAPALLLVAGALAAQVIPLFTASSAGVTSAHFAAAAPSPPPVFLRSRTCSTSASTTAASGRPPTTGASGFLSSTTSRAAPIGALAVGALRHFDAAAALISVSAQEAARALLSWQISEPDREQRIRTMRTRERRGRRGELRHRSVGPGIGDMHHQVLAEQSTGIPSPFGSWRVRELNSNRTDSNICAHTMTARARSSCTSRVCRSM